MSAIILSRNSLIEVILRWSRTRRPSRPSRDTLDRLIPRGLLQLRRSRSVQQGLWRIPLALGRPVPPFSRGQSLRVPRGWLVDRDIGEISRFEQPAEPPLEATDAEKSAVTFHSGLEPN